MSVAFDIARTGIATRLVGVSDDAAALDRRLRQVLAQDVLPMAAESLGDDLGDDTIICIPELSLSLALTLQEAMSGAGAKRWSAALTKALTARITSGDGIWHFANQWDFLGAYLRVRLGAARIPSAVFSGLTAMDLLTPAQAVTEALRQWPELWPWLVCDEHQNAALDWVRAVHAQGGDGVCATVLHIGLTSPPIDAAKGSDEDWISVLRMLARGDPLVDLWAHARAADMALSDAARALLFALLLAKAPGLTLAPTVVTRVALILSLMARHLEQHPSPKPIHWPTELRAHAATLPVTLRRIADDLITALENIPESATLLAQLAKRMHEHSTPIKTNAEPTAQGTPDTTDEPVQPSDACIYHSPIAGVALLLPFLTENRIGRDFSAQMRLAALAALAEGGPVSEPLEDPVLRAICGHDDRDELSDRIPSRPNAMDMIFVPQNRQAAIEKASAGYERLAEWMLARFAASLPGLGASTRSFLQAQFLHHAGRVSITHDRLIIEIDAMPLRPVLEMGGMTGAERGRADWLDNQQISVRVREVAR